MEQTLEALFETRTPLGLETAWIDSDEAFQGLAPEWNAFAVDNAFVTYAWMSAWWETCGHKRKLAIITVRDENGRLVGLAPFCIEKAWLGCLPVRRVRFLADTLTGSDYLSVLADPSYEARVTGEIVRMLEQHRDAWDCIALHDAADSPLLTDLRFQLDALGMRCRRKTAATCYYVQLPDTQEKFLQTLSSHLRCNYKRRWRKLEAEGKVEFVSISDPATLRREFPVLLALHRMRFLQRRESSAFITPQVLAFHAKALTRLGSSGIARLFLIRVDGQAVAALYGFGAGHTFQFYQCGMHPEWKQKGVGQMMTGRAIEEAIGLGFSEFDFLRGGEAYKAHWADHARSTVTLRFFDSRWKSRYAEAVWLASEAARKAKAAIRQRLLRDTTGDE